MAAPEGWTFVKTEETCDLTDFVPNSAKLSIKDYFEVISERARKCRLCSSTVNITAKSFWNLKRHFKAKHIAEWNEVEPIIKNAKSKVRDSSEMPEMNNCPPCDIHCVRFEFVHFRIQNTTMSQPLSMWHQRIQIIAIT